MTRAATKRIAAPRTMTVVNPCHTITRITSNVSAMVNEDVDLTSKKRKLDAFGMHPIMITNLSNINALEVTCFEQSSLLHIFIEEMFPDPKSTSTTMIWPRLTPTDRSMIASLQESLVPQESSSNKVPTSNILSFTTPKRIDNLNLLTFHDNYGYLMFPCYFTLHEITENQIVELFI